jgi:DNA-binding NarL/FixJ family response regulator
MRVIVASDHPIARHGLSEIIRSSSHAEIVAESPTWQSLLTEVETAKPDVALLDIERPSLGWIQAIHKIRSRYPFVLLGCLTSSPDPVFMEELSALGARFIAIHGRDEQEVLQFIARCAQQRPETKATSKVLRTLRSLTPRELETVRMIAEGSTNAEIAETLGVSIRTVEFHRSNIMRKTGARTAADLARLAIESGLLPGQHLTPSALELPS